MKRTNEHTFADETNKHAHIDIFSLAFRIHSFIWITKQANVDFLRSDNTRNERASEKNE